MSQTIANIEAEALKLPRNDRAKVALYLLDSLEQEKSDSSPEAIEKAWVEESVRRLEAYHRGEMKSYSVEEVIKELEKSAE
jgi:putative addiction module component (TIGR02574 family)